MARRFFVYILTSRRNTVLYTGVTGDLSRRLLQHRSPSQSGSFTGRYNVTKLVYFESTDSAVAALAREKQIKAGSRERKIALVESMNPDWLDLWNP